MVERKPSGERRREIGDAVLRIVGRRGAAALTTSSLAAEVGVTTGALFRHFATLDDVLREAVRQALEKMEATFPDASLPPTERIFQLARNRVRLLSSDAGLDWLVRSEQALLMIPPDAAASLQTLVSRSRRFLLDALEQGAREESIRKDVPPEALLVIVMGTIHALAGSSGIHRRVRSPSGLGPERILEALRGLIEPPRPSGRKPRTAKERKK